MKSQPRTFEISTRIREGLYFAGIPDTGEVEILRGELDKTRAELNQAISTMNEVSVNFAEHYARLMHRLEDSESTIAIVAFEPHKQDKSVVT